MRVKINNRDAYVIKEEVDEKNHLWYVIEENGEEKKEDAETVDVNMIPDEMPFIPR
jgi:hypothetical protein